MGSNDSKLSIYYKCKNCDDTFDDPDVIIDHLQAKHGIISKRNNYKKYIKKLIYEFRCNTCKLYIKTINDLKNHMIYHMCPINKIDETNWIDMFKCHTCNIYIYNDEVNGHLLSGSKQHQLCAIKSKYKCELCDSHFGDAIEHYMHIRDIHNIDVESVLKCNVKSLIGTNFAFKCKFCKKYTDGNNAKNFMNECNISIASIFNGSCDRNINSLPCNGFDSIACFVLSGYYHPNT